MAELIFDQLGSVEHCPQTCKNLAQFTIGRSQFLESFGLLKLQFLHPVKGEPIQKGGVVLGTTHPKELHLKPL